MLGKCMYHTLVATCLLFGFAQAKVLIADPKDVTVEVNQWTKFNCTVHCEYSKTVSWYMAGHNGAIKRNNTIPGLLIKLKRSPDVKCTLSNEKTHYFEVYATEAFNKSAFYCAAYEQHHQERSCSCGKGGRCYSRPALLTVKMAATVNPPTQASVTQTPAPSNCSTSDLTASSPEGRSSMQAASEQAVVQS